MYLHEVHTVKTDDSSPFKTGPSETSELPGGENHPSINNIFEKLLNVKSEDARFRLEGVDDSRLEKSLRSFCLRAKTRKNH